MVTAPTDRYQLVSIRQPANHETPAGRYEHKVVDTHPHHPGRVAERSASKGMAEAIRDLLNRECAIWFADHAAARDLPL